jgi:lipoprotein NlpI
MNNHESVEKNIDLMQLSVMVRNSSRTKDLQKCFSCVIDAMSKYPHSPQPHNLIGVLLVKEGNHAQAMKHFRAAWALDPTFIPARWNLENFGTFYSSGKFALDEEDCVAS